MHQQTEHVGLTQHVVTQELALQALLPEAELTTEFLQRTCVER